MVGIGQNGRGELNSVPKPVRSQKNGAIIPFYMKESIPVQIQDVREDVIHYLQELYVIVNSPVAMDWIKLLYIRNI
jgi:hypothetical protein